MKLLVLAAFLLMSLSSYAQNYRWTRSDDFYGNVERVGCARVNNNNSFLAWTDDSFCIKSVGVSYKYFYPTTFGYFGDNTPKCGMYNPSESMFIRAVQDSYCDKVKVPSTQPKEAAICSELKAIPTSNSSLRQEKLRLAVVNKCSSILKEFSREEICEMNSHESDSMISCEFINNGSRDSKKEIEVNSKKTKVSSSKQ